MEAQFELWLVSQPDIALVQTRFVYPQQNVIAHSYRGKGAGLLQAHGSFQWTRAVRALAVLMLRAADHGLQCGAAVYGPVPLLSGERDSLAASLDFCITKHPRWLDEMFGGSGIAKRLFYRANTERRAGGAVLIGLNPNVLSPEAIVVYLDEVPVSDPRVLAQLGTRLSRSGVPRREEPICRDFGMDSRNP